MTQLQKLTLMHRFYDEEFQYSIKLRLFDDQIIFNWLLCCSCSTRPTL